MNFYQPTLKRAKSLGTIILLCFTFTFTSCGEPGKGNNFSIPGVNGPTVTLVEDGLLISFIFENLVLDGGVRYPIPNYENSYAEISPDFASGGTLLAFYVSLQDLNNEGLQFLPPESLPGGRPLPGVKYRSTSCCCRFH